MIESRRHVAVIVAGNYGKSDCTMGYSSNTANVFRRSDYVGLEATVKASRMAYKLAKIKPKNVEVATVHDCFTIAELMAMKIWDFAIRAKWENSSMKERRKLVERSPLMWMEGSWFMALSHELTKQLSDEGNKQTSNICS